MTETQIELLKEIARNTNHLACQIVETFDCRTYMEMEKIDKKLMDCFLNLHDAGTLAFQLWEHNRSKN